MHLHPKRHLTETLDILNRKNTTDPYIAACKRLNIVPISYVMQRLNGQEIVMPHHGLGSKGAEALAAVLGVRYK